MIYSSEKPTNINRIQIYQFKTLRQTTKAPHYVYNHKISIPFILNVAKIYYKRFHNRI